MILVGFGTAGLLNDRLRARQNLLGISLPLDTLDPFADCYSHGFGHGLTG